MEKCSKCGMEVPSGDYLEVDGKIVCFSCFRGKKIKLRREDIYCPVCHQKYKSGTIRCPNCHEMNPLFDMNLGEFAKNFIIGYLILNLVIYLIVGIVRYDNPIELVNQLPGFVVFIIIFLALEFVFIIGSYYLGQMVRDIGYHSRIRRKP